MAISKVQGPYSAGGTTAVSATFGSTPTQGNLLVAWLSNTAGNTEAVSGFTLAISGIEGSDGIISIWYKIAGASEPTQVDATVTSGTSTFIVIEEWTGLTSPVLDKTAKTDDTGGTVSSRSSGTTEITTVAEELAISGVSYGNQTTAQSWSNSFTDERSLDTETIACGSKILSSAAAIETTLSWTTARRAGGCIATFMAAAVSGGNPWYYYAQQ